MWAESSLPSLYPGGFWGISILSSAVPKVGKLVARVTELFGIICFFSAKFKRTRELQGTIYVHKVLEPCSVRVQKSRGSGSNGWEMDEFGLKGPSKVTLRVADTSLPPWDFWVPLTSTQPVLK